MSIRIYPYGPSNSVSNLLKEIPGALQIKRARSKYRHNPRNLVVNWGASRRPDVLNNVRVLNDFQRVEVATSKQGTFRALLAAGVKCPEWTRDRAVAQGWLANCKVVARDLDHGSQGRGITVYPRRGTIDRNHQFYVKYFKKERELRIHVFQGKVIFEQEKLQKNGAKEDANYDKYIRSHDRGWCFAFQHLRDDPVPESCREEAIKACKALGLDFGAVDLGWNGRSGPCVFEVNTAPGIEESSVKAYAEAIQNAR